MIITALLMLMTELWLVAFGVLPNGTLPDGVETAIETAVSWLYVMNITFDVDTLLELFALYVVIEIAINAVQFFFWAYSKIPFIGR